MNAIARWDLPSIQDSAVPEDTEPVAREYPSATGAPPTVAHLEAIERNAYEEAFARGHAEGLAAAEQQLQSLRLELDQQLSTVRGMMAALAQPLDQLDADVEQQLLTLALSVARQLVRRELRVEPTQVIAIIRETVALLPASARDVCVHLHPLDAALVREKLVTPDRTPAWQLREDPVLARGDCRISSASAQVDARLETRLQAAASALLGEQRTTSAGRTQAADDAMLPDRDAAEAPARDSERLI